MNDDNSQDEVKINILEGNTEDISETVNMASDNKSTSPENQAAVSLSLENLIRGHISTLTRIKNEIAEHNDTMNNILDNDITYKQHAEEAKKATKVKTATKSEIMKRPDVRQLADKIKAAREEVKEQGQTLSELLAEYQRSTGLDSIELEDGKVKKIVVTAKLS
jgi:hypothetical protein